MSVIACVAVSAVLLKLNRLRVRVGKNGAMRRHDRLR